jgi:hypothetical protein
MGGYFKVMLLILKYPDYAAATNNAYIFCLSIFISPVIQNPIDTENDFELHLGTVISIERAKVQATSRLSTFLFFYLQLIGMIITNII